MICIVAGGMVAFSLFVSFLYLVLSIAPWTSESDGYAFRMAAAIWAVAAAGYMIVLAVSIK